MKSSRLFITGCDSKTEWMLPWFVENFKKHMPNEQLMIFDFGMESDLYPELRKSHRTTDVGWFKKPSAMMKASNHAYQVCWLDTDCHIQADISDIFDHVETNKIAMAVDNPWTNRRREKWHNSGVVAFEGCPSILGFWATEVSRFPKVGDQEVLHEMVKDDMKRMIHITDLPHEYNTLRLDVLDGTTPKNIKVMHWTGAKGKMKIKELMNE
jgi:hypothetical protein